MRNRKRVRKYLGNRRWGVGNIKHNRGAGSRGGVGKAGWKHRQSYRVVYEKDAFTLHKGFFRFRKEKRGEINLDLISKKISESKEGKPEIELGGYKVLGSGTLAKPAVIKADAFSKKALEKIKQAGGEAVVKE